MGLSESKEAFEKDEIQQTPKVNKEIGISSMWDPRSPSSLFERTPIKKKQENYIGCVESDPRSPTCDVPRTPINTEDGHITEKDRNVYSQLRMQLEKLQIHDGGLHNITASTESLHSDNESINVISQQNTVLEFLSKDFESQDNTVPCHEAASPFCKLQSTPKQLTPLSPNTPMSLHETDRLVKKGKSQSKKQHDHQDKLQKKVLKKSIASNQVARMPLSQRKNFVVTTDNHSKPSYGDKLRSKAFVKYRQYNNLEDSFNDSLTGKENENIVW